MGRFATWAFAKPRAMNEAELRLHGASAEMKIFREVEQEIDGLKADFNK